MRLILTARRDHDPDHPLHRPGGPRVHFDLAGFDILFWEPERLGDFRRELEKQLTKARWDLDRLNAELDSLRAARAEHEASSEVGIEELRKKLEENNWNVKRTAETLSMQRSNLYKKMDKYGLR